MPASCHSQYAKWTHGERKRESNTSFHSLFSSFISLSVPFVLQAYITELEKKSKHLKIEKAKERNYAISNDNNNTKKTLLALFTPNRPTILHSLSGEPPSSCLPNLPQFFFHDFYCYYSCFSLLRIRKMKLNNPKRAKPMSSASSTSSFLRAVVAIAILLCFLTRAAESSRIPHHHHSPSLGDEISALPGQPSVGFRQYSGYVTVDDSKHKSLFYYFVEAEVDPASKPLVLWLNGGPGCSSLGVGALSENGPFRPKGQVLVRNEYSWNREANMLYLESPIGVGYSYAIDTTAYEGVSDLMTAKDNLVFLQRWFAKFPQYKDRDLFITGESYAGHYIPQLAKLMVEFNKRELLFNLKGIALGNPVLEFATDFNSRAEYIWSHGLISDSTYKLFTSMCNYSRYVGEYYRGSVSSICSRVMSQVSRETSRFVDKYDVTLDVCIPSVLSQSKVLSPQGASTEAIDVCVEDETVNYLNRKDVQRALHARLVNVRRWEVCSSPSILDYQLLDVEIPTIDVVGSLVNSGVRVLVYSGDQDSAIPFIGSRSLVHQLAMRLGLNTTIPYRVWFAGQQVGGWTQVYGDLLSFATIRGAAHETPFSQPERSLVLFESFLDGRALPQMFE